MEGRMKTIGVIGGVSWEASAAYYRLLNQAVKSKLGSLHSADLVMYSLDFAPVVRLEHEERWDELAMLLIGVAHRLEAAGASSLLIASNTLHNVASQVQSQLRIPLLHIADAVAAEVRRAGVKSVGLLGTRFVMEKDFYKERLAASGLEITIPPAAERDIVHDIIYNELARGEMKETSRREVLQIMDHLRSKGARGVILGNTELPLLLDATHTSVRLFDSMKIHVNTAVSLALSE
jgi:aspartate racemase